METKVRKQDILHKKNEFKNMRELVEWAAVTYSDRVGYSFRVKPLDKDSVKKSYVEMRDDVRGLATELHSRGFAGKHIAVVVFP